MNSGSWSSRKLIASWKARAQTILILVACTVAIVGVSIWLFGFLLPSLSSGRPAAYERNRAILEQQARVEQINGFWQDRLPTLVPLLRLAGVFGLALLGVWCVYRVFMWFAQDLDEAGHWERLISRRSSRHDRND